MTRKKDIMKSVTSFTESISVREFTMKSQDKGYCCRFLVCVSSLIFVVVGGIACYMGIYLTTSGPSTWLPATSPTMGSSFSIGSLVAGAIAAVLACVGCIGACRRNRACICLFGVLVALLLVIAAAMFAIVWETRWAVGAWRDADYRFYGEIAVGNASVSTNLSAPAIHTLGTIYKQVGTLYALCDPVANTTAPIISALASGGALPQPALLTCSEPAMELFGGWASGYCLNGEGVLPKETVSGCMADVSLAGGAFDSYEEAAWVFCACGRAISVAINEDWFTNANFVCLGLLIYLSLLCCVVCCTYRNAKHAAKQRKKDAFELETLKAAEREAGRGGDAGGLGGIGSASMRADEVYIEASRV